MEKILEALQFSTGVPFGYAVFYGLCLIAAFLGAGFVVLAIFVRGRLRIPLGVGGGTVAAFVVTMVFANIVFENDVDLNPVFGTKDVVGGWSEGGTHILFREDGTAHVMLDARYAEKLGRLPAEVRWRKSGDFDITLTGEGAGDQPPELRVIAFGTRLRIVAEFGDPDSWDHDLGLMKDSER
jgi:hypothetical protein